MENIVFAIRTFWGAVVEVSPIVIILAMIAAARFAVAHFSREN